MGKILVTGGAGYIGSQICKLLRKDKNEIIIFDNLSTGKKKYTKYGKFIYGDLRNKKDIYKTFKNNKIGFGTTNPDAPLHVSNVAPNGAWSGSHGVRIGGEI